jgi:hypothetical protein
MNATASFITPWTCAAVFGPRFPEAAFSVALGAAGYLVHEAGGRAMAAVKLGKPIAEVTREEAAATLTRTGFVTDGNAELTGRTLRAGVKAMVLKLEPDLFNEYVAGVLIAELNRLEAGETENLVMLKPAETNRRKSPGADAEDASILSVEVTYQQAKHNIPKDEAIEIVTGISRGAERPTAVAGLDPILPVGAMTMQTVRRLVERGCEDNPDLVAAARAEGEVERRGEPTSLFFQAFRRDYIATWAARFRAGRAPGQTGVLPKQP